MRGALLVVWAGALAQFRWLLATPAAFIGRIVITPVLTSIFFFLFLQISGRLDTLVAFAVVAPALSTAWSAALGIAGETVDGERAQGTLEPLIIAPQSAFLLSVTGRILATSVFSLIGLAESILVGRLIFDAPIVVHQPVALVVLLLLTVLSVAAAGVIMASTFVLGRSVRLFQNLLSTPFLLLGGVAFPVSVLPDWLQPLSRLISLSWGAEGLRQALSTQPVSWLPYVMLILLTIVYGIIGYYLLARVERSIRTTGAIGVS
jgi:ABC-2 type transport system permease protein